MRRDYTALVLFGWAFRGGGVGAWVCGCHPLVLDHFFDRSLPERNIHEADNDSAQWQKPFSDMSHLEPACYRISDISQLLPPPIFPQSLRHRNTHQPPSSPSTSSKQLHLHHLHRRPPSPPHLLQTYIFSTATRPSHISNPRSSSITQNPKSSRPRKTYTQASHHRVLPKQYTHQFQSTRKTLHTLSPYFEIMWSFPNVI